MERSEFSKLTGISLLSPELMQNIPELSEAQKMQLSVNNSLFNVLVTVNDQLTETLLRRQELNKSHPWFGGVRDEYEIHTAGGTAELVKVLISAYVSPESKPSFSVVCESSPHAEIEVTEPFHSTYPAQANVPSES